MTDRRLRGLTARIAGDGGWLALFGRLARFGAVGATAYVVDVLVFNLLISFGPHPWLAGSPLLAKTCSTAVATVVAWLGNRYWTFRGRRNAAALREFLVFACACTAGLAVNLAVLWISHYVLGFTSVLADNIAGNVVGVALGSALRFTAYSLIVFPTRGGSPVAADPVLGSTATTEEAGDAAGEVSKPASNGREASALT